MILNDYDRFSEPCSAVNIFKKTNEEKDKLSDGCPANEPPLRNLRRELTELALSAEHIICGVLASMASCHGLQLSWPVGCSTCGENNLQAGCVIRID
jgi:hypothetical protein